MKKRFLIVFILALLALTALSATAVNDISKVNKFDSLIMNPYSKPLDDTATIINYISMATPALLAINVLILNIIMLKT